MQIIPQPDQLRETLNAVFLSGKSVGFVPTMGALHEGHASLVRQSVEDNDVTVVSIYVNPTQFDRGEDLERYPRTIEKDAELLSALNADLIFAPSDAVMYPRGKNNLEIRLGLSSLDRIMEGAKRPGHFDGVLQIVARLFNIVRPTRAYFGRKDFQQVAVLSTLARELFFPLELIACPTVREPDGLALSSRNQFLNSEARQQALYLHQSLSWLQSQAAEGLPTAPLIQAMLDKAADFPLIDVEYLEIRAWDDLRPLDILRAEDRPVALIAAFCGPTRLIDNMELFSQPH